MVGVLTTFEGSPLVLRSFGLEWLGGMPSGGVGDVECNMAGGGPVAARMWRYYRVVVRDRKVGDMDDGVEVDVWWGAGGVLLAG